MPEKSKPQPQTGPGGRTPGRARWHLPGGRRCLLCLPVFLALLGLSLLLAPEVSAQESCPVPLEERQRYGFAAFSANWPETFAIDQLRAGWYVDFTASTPPDGMDRALVLRVHPGYRLDASTLGPLVDANPGVMWLIGNEPDCIWQDNVYPEEYAGIYHDLYSFIKDRDRTSQVAAGGIVQPTPLRLEYLDRVLAAYQARYGQALPVDLWHIHNAILNEQLGGWGAGIPPGIDAEEGVLRAIDDNDNMVYFEEQVWAFRQWMASRGYGGYPLVITEFGVLLPDDYGYDVTRVNAFMSATFGFLSTATDLTLGDPNDGHRLVQRWAWFSLDIPPWDPEYAPGGFNGNLFDPDTTSITAHGSNYASLTDSSAPVDYVDLALPGWRIFPSTSLAGPTQTVSVTVQLWVANLGTSPASAFEVELGFGGPASGVQVQTLPGLDSLASTWLTFTLEELPAGRYSISARVDADGDVAESRECNNQDSITLVVPTHRAFLPVMSNGGRATAIGLAASGMRGGAPPIASGARGAVGLQPFDEYPLPTAASYPAQLAYDAASGVLWVSERDGNKIARFDPGTELWTEYGESDGLTPSSQPWGLALDGNGDVWFAESGADQIGKLDVSAGTFTEYGQADGLTPGSQPWGIAVGAGRVWFTERAGDRLGKLDPLTGSVTEYALPAGAAPGGIAFWSGAFDYLWFAETGANRLGLAAFDGGALSFVVHYFPIDAADLAAPEDVALNSVGNPWVTGRESNNLSTFYFSTLQGWYHVPVHSPASEPYGVAVAGTSPIWFTERAANKLGQYRSGGIFEYDLPSPGSQPSDVAIDAAGCALYTAPGANRIGRLCNPQHHFTYLPLISRSWQDQG